MKKKRQYELLNIPDLFPNETDPSYVVRTKRRCPGHSFDDIRSAFFGSSSRYSDQSLQIGYDTLDALFRDATGNEPTPPSVVRFSYLEIARPFADPQKFAVATTMSGRDKFSTIGAVVHLRVNNLLRYSPWLCLACTKVDIKTYGHSYWRRSHQIHGVTLCATHGVRLIGKCSGCNTEFSNLTLPTIHCRRCGKPLGQPHISRSVTAELLRRELAFCVAIDAAFFGRIPHVELTTRLSLFGDRLEATLPKGSKFSDMDVDKILRDYFGDSVINSINFPTVSGAKLSVAQIILDLQFVEACPVTNCLFIAMLFDSVDAYVIAAKQYTQSRAVGGKATVMPTSHRMSWPFLRVLLAAPAFPVVAKRFAIRREEIQRWGKSLDILERLTEIRIRARGRARQVGN